jgi:hypothetical protein
LLLTTVFDLLANDWFWHHLLGVIVGTPSSDDVVFDDVSADEPALTSPTPISAISKHVVVAPFLRSPPSTNSFSMLLLIPF